MSWDWKIIVVTGKRSSSSWLQAVWILVLCLKCFLAQKCDRTQYCLNTVMFEITNNSNVQCSWSLELPLRVLPTAASEKRSQNEVAIRRTYLEHAKLLSRERNYELVSDLVVEEKLYINFNQQFKSLKQVLKPTTAAIRQIHWSSNGQHAKKTPSLFSRCSVTWFHHFIRDLITHDQGRSFELSCWWPGRELDRFTGKLIQKKTLTRKYFTNFGTSYRSFYWKTHPDQIS